MYRIGVLSLAAVIPILLLIGCDETRDPVRPTPSVPVSDLAGATGAADAAIRPTADDAPSAVLSLDVHPASMAAAWSLNGPGGLVLSGRGDTTMATASPGAYVVVWSPVDGFLTPPPDTLDLVADRNAVLVGRYRSTATTLFIDPEPDYISADWQLSGPEGFSLAGTGDRLLTDLPAGTYSVVWSAVSGWDRPEAEEIRLDEYETARLAGVHERLSGAPEYILVSAGSFAMGSPPDETGRSFTETPHAVTLTQDFFIRSTEVTRQDYADMLEWAINTSNRLEKIYILSFIGRDTLADPYRFTDTTDGSAVSLWDRDLNDYGISIDLEPYPFDMPDTTIIDVRATCTVPDPDLPLTMVSWYTALAYIDQINTRDGYQTTYDHADWSIRAVSAYAAHGYRLPTEAEWEYACRADGQTTFNTGSCLDSATEANFRGDYLRDGCWPGPYLGGPAPVGSYTANAWNLSDMHGNVWEWCWDGSDGTGYTPNPVTNPAGSGPDRIIRGGGWASGPVNCRSAARHARDPEVESIHTGFRTVRTSF